MKIEVDLSDLRAAVTSAVPHTARPNTVAYEQGFGVVRLQLTGHGLLVSATDQWTLASSLIPAEVSDDEADPVDLTATSIKGLLSVFPAPGKDAMPERIRVESWTDNDRDTAPATVTFTHTGGLFDGASLTVTEYPAEDFPNVATALRGLLAQQLEPVPGVEVSADLLHRFEAASKAFASRLDVRAVRQAEGSERGVLLIGVGTRFLGAARVEYTDDVELETTDAWLNRLPGKAPKDPLAAALVWTTSTTTDGDNGQGAGS